MRIWDIDPSLLCRHHLLGEHRELHALWSILTANKKGYSHHPETRRWRGKTRALYNRHEALVKEMLNRGFTHHSPLKKKLATGETKQSEHVDTPEEQRRRLKGKQCGCQV